MRPEGGTAVSGERFKVRGGPHTLGGAGYLQVRPGLWAVTVWQGNHEECLFPQLCPLPVLSRIKQRAELCHLSVACGER